MEKVKDSGESTLGSEFEPGLDLNQAVKLISDELARNTCDDSYYYKWQDNLARAFIEEFKARMGAQDTCVGQQTLKLIADQGAKRFLHRFIINSRSAMIPAINRKQVNGRFIKYMDVIYHTSVTEFSFWDRVKILFGCRVRIENEIFTMNLNSKVVDSRADTFVMPIFRNPFRKKIKRGIELKP